MTSITSANPTRDDFLDASIHLLEETQDAIGRLIVALRGLPETKTEVGVLFADILVKQDSAWNGLATYIGTEECEGNS